MLRLSWDGHVNLHRSLSGFQQIVLSSTHSLYLRHTVMATLGAWLFLLLVKSEVVCHSTVTVRLPQKLWHGPGALEHLHECPKPVLAATQTCSPVSRTPCWMHGTSESRNSETVHISQCFFLPCSKPCLGVKLIDTIVLLLTCIRIYDIWAKGAGASENTSLPVPLIGSCFLGGVAKLILGEVIWVFPSMVWEKEEV